MNFENMTWFFGNITVRLILAFIFLILFAILYFQITKGSGIVLFIGIDLILAVSFFISPQFQLVAWLILLPMFIYLKWMRDEDQYESAITTLEVIEICRGLREAEVAMILGSTAEVVASVGMASLIKRGILKWNMSAPDRLSLTEAVSNLINPDEVIRASLLDGGMLIEIYEEPIIEQLMIDGTINISDLYLGMFFKLLHRNTSQKILPYDIEATRSYYLRRIEENILGISIGDGTKHEERFLGDKSFWMLINNPDDLEIIRNANDFLVDQIRSNISDNRYQIEAIQGRNKVIVSHQPIDL